MRQPQWHGLWARSRFLERRPRHRDRQDRRQIAGPLRRTGPNQANFKHFSALVAATPADALEAYNADPDIVRVNVVRAVDALREHLDHIAKALPLVNVAELLELPSLALALGFGADKVFTAASRQEIKTHQATLRPARSLTLRYLEIVGELEIIPAEEVQNIRAGKGPLDEARDGVAVVAKLNEYDKKLAGKHPFSAEYLTKLAEDGNWLIKALLPTGAKPGKAGANPDALVRDQLWTEVVRRYDMLYQAGMVIWGRRKVDAHLPALQTRVAAVAKAEAVVVPAAPPMADEPPV